MPIWNPKAIADRKSITRYIAADKPSAAIEFADKLFDAAARLDQHPMLGRIGRVSGTRELVVHSHYLLIYSNAKEYVEIMRVKHAAQQWP